MPITKHLRAVFTLTLLAVSLNACAAPPALQIISLAVDGISYLATDKTVADHGLSAVTDKDCKIIRGFKSMEVCQTEEEVKEALSVAEDTQ